MTDQHLECRTPGCSRPGWNVRWLGRLGVAYLCEPCVQEYDARLPEEPAPDAAVTETKGGNDRG